MRQGQHHLLSEFHQKDADMSAASTFADSAPALGSHGNAVIVLCDKVRRTATIIPYGARGFRIEG
jgi:hypothetical protein